MEISIIKEQALASVPVILPVFPGSGLSDLLADCRVEGFVGVPEAEQFKADLQEVWSMYQGDRHVYLLGLGSRPGFREIQRAFRSFCVKNKQRLSPEITLDLRKSAGVMSLDVLIEAAINGMALSAYQIGRYKTSEQVQHPLGLPSAHVRIWLAADLATAETAARRGLAMAETQQSIFDLVNAPANKKLPADLATWAEASATRHGYQVEVLGKAQLQALGMHALLAVNQGSAHPPRLIITEHKPSQAVARVALVGKGVTFDTGGLSIKPSASMHLMKSDMGGAGAVLGAVEMAARLQLPVHVIGIVPATENSVDAHSMCPSDVIGSYSGKTIEIIDTDAEGRLVLADGLYYAVRHYEPDILIDLATLTGATVRSLGYHAAGLFSNNDELAQALSDAGDFCGERMWRFPLWESYRDEIKSDVADVRNLGLSPVAGAVSAAKFLEVFIDNHPCWAHLDIAGVAFNDTEFSSQKSATAYGVRLLTTYLQQLITDKSR